MKDILNVFLRELKQLRKRKMLLSFMLLLPLISAIIFSEIYRYEILRDVPIAIIDQDHSELSRTITMFVESSNYMKITAYPSSVEEAKELILKGEIQGAFFFPQDMEIDVKKGLGSTVVVYKNTANLVVGNVILRDASTIIRTVSGSVLLKKFRSAGMTEEKAMNIVNAIRVESHALFNPNYSYSTFLVPPLIAAAFQMVIMLSGILLINSEKDSDQWNELVISVKGSAFKIAAGKSAAHFIIHTFTLLLLLLIIFPYYGLDFNASFITMFSAFVLFILASLMPALFLSSLLDDPILSTEAALLINTPAFLFCGLTFPIWGMPDPHTWFAQIIPFTHFLDIFLKTGYMGNSLSINSNSIIVLFLFALIPFILSLPLIKMKIRGKKVLKNLAPEVH